MPFAPTKRRAHLELVGRPAAAPAPIDVSPLLDQLESTLRRAAPPEQRRQALQLVHSWAWNERIAEACQLRARALAMEFDRH